MKEITDFLKRHNFNANPCIEEITNILLDDMKKGLQKDCDSVSSMDMIPIWKNVLSEFPKNKSVITIDAGGTNFRTALVKFSENGTPEIAEFLRYPMPALDREMTNNEFFDKFAEYLEPLKGKAESIAFCFSFAITIYPDGSGEAIKLSKEIKLPGLVHCKINEELHKALIRNGWNNATKIVMVNDTASVLQAGILEKTDGEEFSGNVGFVLGTGLNSAYIEYDAIEKIQDSPDYVIPQIVVCESGKCNKIPQSDFDKELSQNSKLPNEYFLERMCSGRYLGQVSSIALRTAAKENIFSTRVNKKLQNIQNVSTEIISDFLKAKNERAMSWLGFKNDFTNEDYRKVYEICESVFYRSGILSAGILASACLKMDKGKDVPICISADGSVFLKGFLVRKTIEKALNSFLTEKKGIRFVIKTLENPVTIGSAFFA